MGKIGFVSQRMVVAGERHPQPLSLQQQENSWPLARLTCFLCSAAPTGGSPAPAEPAFQDATARCQVSKASIRVIPDWWRKREGHHQHRSRRRARAIRRDEQRRRSTHAPRWQRCRRTPARGEHQHRGPVLNDGDGVGTHGRGVHIETLQRDCSTTSASGTQRPGPIPALCNTLILLYLHHCIHLRFYIPLPLPSLLRWVVIQCASSAIASARSTSLSHC
jgi:hypothetical protein